jgi:heme oxygenase
MRQVAMKLHTREQAPKEGGTDAPPKQQAWVPTRIGYARFLAESKVVFGAFESIMAAADGHPECEWKNGGPHGSTASWGD